MVTINITSTEQSSSWITKYNMLLF